MAFLFFQLVTFTETIIYSPFVHPKFGNSSNSYSNSIEESFEKPGILNLKKTFGKNLDKSTILQSPLEKIRVRLFYVYSKGNIPSQVTLFGKFITSTL